MTKHITKTNLPICVNGEFYMYKTHPHQCRCEIINNKINMLCSVCNKNVTNNWCECSLNKKLLHQDRVMMRNAIKSNKHTPETHTKFKKAKGCTLDHFKFIFNEIDLKYGKGEGTWSFDHIISPVYNFDLNNEKHRAFIFHFKNIQKMTYPSNQQKGCKVVQSEIDYVMSVIDDTDIDKIHNQLEINRKEYKKEAKEIKDIKEGKEITPTRDENEKRKQDMNNINQYFSNKNSIINQLFKEKEKESANLNKIKKRIESINNLIHSEILKSYNEIQKQNSDIELKINELQEKKNKNDISISLLNNYLNE
jgi:hypothetical protein